MYTELLSTDRGSMISIAEEKNNDASRLMLTYKS